MAKRFYKNKLYLCKYDSSICKYITIEGEFRYFKQLYPEANQEYRLVSEFWSPRSNDDLFEVFNCELLEILLGMK